MNLRAVAWMCWWFAAGSGAVAGAIPGLVTNWGDSSDNLGLFPGGILTNVTAISCGLSNNLALKADGTMVAWGSGLTNSGTAPDYGQSIVPANLAHVTAIAAGEYHTLALSNGYVLAWGDNVNGQTSVPSGLSGVMAIAAGSMHSLALRSNGTVAAWGYNGFGETNVPAGLAGVSAVSGGDIHSLALLSNGTVAAWGGNNYGQTNVPAGLNNAVAVAAGMDHSLALLANGTVAAWGYNGFGETNVPPGLSNVAAIAAGGHTSAAILSNGLVTTWGQLSNFPSGLANVSLLALDNGHGLAATLNPVLLTPAPEEIFPAAGGAVTFGATFWSGTALHYQWAFNGAPIAGATQSNLTVANFAPANAGLYTLTVSNAYNFLQLSTVLRLSNSPVILVNGADVGGGVTNINVSAQISITNSGSGGAIYYTLDGSTPDFTSTPYGGAFTLTSDAIVTAVAYNAAYTAEVGAAPVTVQILPEFSLTATAPGGGSISVSPAPTNGNAYLGGTVVTLTAMPSNGWTFLGWSGDSTSTSPVLNLAMTTNHSVQAVFGTPLSTNILGSGQLTFSPAESLYPYGSVVQVAAQPAAGSYLFAWEDAAAGFANPLSLTVSSTNGLTALFGKLASNQVTLSVVPVGNGSVVVSPSNNVYTNGQTVTLAANPSSNAVFTVWGDSVSATNTNPLTTVLTSNETITATFISGGQTNPPTITQPPLSQTASPGAATTLGVRVTGPGPFTYQWLFDSNAIAGANAPTLALFNLQPPQAGYYNVVVTNPYGSVTSAPAAVDLLSLRLAPTETQAVPLLVVNGAGGSSCLLQFCADLTLTNWVLLDTLTLADGAAYFIDSVGTNVPVRFYRAIPRP